MGKQKPSLRSFKSIQGIKHTIYRISTKQEEGSIIIALGLGAIMLGGVALALTTANRNKTDTISKERLTQAVNIAEGGITRYLDFLSRHSEIAVYCSTDGLSPCDTGGPTWETATLSNLSSAGTSYCVDGSSGGSLTSDDIDTINDMANTDWKEFMGDTEYRLVSYIYQPSSTTGILTVEGRTSPNDSNGIARLEVSIPVTSNTSSQECPIPGIWVPSTGTVKVYSSGSINAVVKKTNISTPTSVGINPFGGEDFPSDSLHGSEIYDATTEPSVGTINVNMPSVPATTPPGTEAIFSNGTALDLSECTIRLPRKVGDNAWGSGCQSSITDKFNGITSPDTPDASGRYHYLFPSSSTFGGDSITLSNAAIKIEPNAGQKVVFYVKGKILMSGTGDNGSGHSLSTSATRDPNPTDQNGLGCEMTNDTGTANITTFINQGSATNLEIYGADGSLSNWSNGSTSTMVDISGNTRINGFMLFPKAEITVSQGLLSGSVWAEKFDFSNTSGCTMGVIQNAVGNILGRYNTPSPTNTINSVSSWQRREVNSP